MIKSTMAMVILAAGASKRMKTIKQLLPWKNTTLLGNVIEQGLHSNVDAIYVVLGANSAKIKDKISNYEIQIIENKNWEQGIGSSIASAINYFKQQNIQYNSVLITLADQPLIDANYYNQLINYHLKSNNKIIASNINNKPSVPAIFDAFYFNQLSQLNQDKGAKRLIESNPNDVYMLNQNANLVDVDTLETYNAIFIKFGNC